MIKKTLIYTIVLGIIGAIVGVVIDMTLIDDPNEYVTYIFLCLGVGAVVGVLCGVMSKPSEKKIKHKTKGTTAGGEEIDLSYDAHWLKPADIGKQHGLIDTTWSQLPSLKSTGIVFRSVVEGGKYHIGMKDEYHCLVIGSTGSGKTSFILVPTIRILAHTGEKPNMIVSDPKGELFEKTSRIVEDEGYRVMTLNLRDPFASTRWNPMENAYDIYHKGLNCRKNIKKCSNGARPKDLGFAEITGVTYGQEWFGFEGVAYPNENDLRVAVASAEQIYRDNAFNELRNICNTIAPKSDTASDPTWEEGAQDFLYGVALAMLEDSADPELGMTKEKFNFYNLYKIAMYRDPDPDAPFQTLQKYLLQGRDNVRSNVPSLTSPVINNAPTTTKSYLGVLSGKITFMSDIGIAYLTSQSDISFASFMDKPTVFYLVIPDDREERYGLATLCISQLYNALVVKANETSGKLPKHVYFLLDEFGNLPRIPKFESMITVSRGRNIFYEIIVQSYTQLDTQYGDKAGATIRSNCNAQIFLGTDDQATLDSFSKLCGEVQLMYDDENVSESKDNKGESGGKQVSHSTQRTTRPLISPYELSKIAFGEQVVTLMRYSPMRLKGTRNDQVPMFYVKLAERQVGGTKSLDTEKVTYDIKLRNQKVLKQQPRF